VRPSFQFWPIHLIMFDLSHPSGSAERDRPAWTGNRAAATHSDSCALYSKIPHQQYLFDWYLPALNAFMKATCPTGNVDSHQYGTDTAAATGSPRG